MDLRTGNCYTEYNISRNGLSVCGGDITIGGYNANSRNIGIVGWYVTKIYLANIVQQRMLK